jgi:hypothetical protein
MSIDLVRGELERLYSLDELLVPLHATSWASSRARWAEPPRRRRSQGRSPIGAWRWTRSLALVDALLASRTEVDPRLRELSAQARSHEELKAGETFAGFTITKKLGDGPRGIVYARTKGGARPRAQDLRAASVRGSDARCGATSRRCGSPRR